MLKKVTWPINPKRTAVVVVDMQGIFCNPEEPLYVPSTVDIIEPIQRLTQTARSHHMPVVYLRHVVRGDGSDTGRFRDLYPDADSQFAQDHPAIDVIDSLYPQKGDIVVDKLFYSGFHNTDLDVILRMKDIDTVIVCGTVTNVCCETTIRDGVHREYKMIALSDANAAMPYPDMGYGEISAEQVQRIALSAIAYEFGEVTTTADIIERIEHANV
ncbi:isochorismatase family protein [Celerinatantimonas sp. MCCC 1A17872]|uniref:isochorismatase family protein n=1 Tax=Celerinatantimonas sp. MCCC 1A17872 TaxID=3177514 RepID=UPI0038BF05F4